MHAVLAACGRCEGTARVHGELWDLGAYPGLVLRGDSVVLGELWWIVDIRAWAALDRYEGVGSDDNGAFVRVVTPLLDREISAWVYVWPHSTERAQRIDGADVWVPRGQP